MLSLEDFLRTHGKAAERIARGDDEIFTESLVLRFVDYVTAFNGTGDIKAYVLMRMRYAVLKILYNRRKFEQRFGAPLVVDPVANEPVDTAESDTVIALRSALKQLPEDVQAVLTLWSNGYTQQEISAELGVCIRSVRQRLKSGLIQVSRELGNEISFD